MSSLASAQSIDFVFNGTPTINGNSSLGSDFKTTVDGSSATPTIFNLNSLISGLQLSLTPASNAATSDISNTADGLGVDSGGDMKAAGDSLTFSFNQAITLDFLEFGSFTDTGSDELLIIFSNSNPNISITDSVLDSQNQISFTSGTSLAANESFTLSYVGGDFSLEELSITVVPEPGTYALLAGMCGLTFVMLKRRRD